MGRRNLLEFAGGDIAEVYAVGYASEKPVFIGGFIIDINICGGFF